MIRWILGVLATLGCVLLHAQERQISVVFLNPGYADEPFWTDYSRHMQDAADDLGVQLQVFYGERDAVRVLRTAREVLASAQRPDYLIFANEHFVGPEILRLYANSDIQLFALHSTLTSEQQALAGGSRERYANWLGSLVPNDEEAGYLMGKALIEQAQGKEAELLAFTGVKQTPTATLRVEGLQRALAEAPHVRLQQVLYGEWRRERAYEQAQALLPRYPNVRLIWSANDEMAFGVMQAAREQGRTLHYTALNNAPQTLQARAEQHLDVLASGHFILGGCALVMLYDHANSLDFAERGGRDQVAPLLRLVDAQQASHLLKRLKQKDIGLDYRRFSALENPQMSRYTCSIDGLLN